MNMLRRDLPSRPDVRAGVPASAARPMPAAAAPRPQPGAMPARPQTPTPSKPKTDELFLVIRQLSELLTKENAALKRHRADEVKAYTERKEQLARLYQGHMNAIHREPQALK